MSIRLKTKVFQIAYPNARTWRLPSYRRRWSRISVDIYLYLEYGVAVPSVAVIQKAVKKSAVYDMADVALEAVNIHVVGIATEKSQTRLEKTCLMRTSSMTDEILLESRRDLRKRAFQALMALEYDGRYC